MWLPEADPEVCNNVATHPLSPHTTGTGDFKVPKTGKNLPPPPSTSSLLIYAQEDPPSHSPPPLPATSIVLG